MNRRCSLRLDLTGEGKEWSWRMFFRTPGPNPSIDRKIPIPQQISPDEIISSLYEKLNMQEIARIQTWGNHLWQTIFPQQIKGEIEDTIGGDILFNVPPNWANIPFELCYIANKGFIGKIFQIGTIICLESENRIQKELPPYKRMLIIADPAGNLPSSHNEGMDLKEFAKKGGIETHFISSGDKMKILEAIETSSMVHFAGHSLDTGEPDSTGWMIGPDKILNITEIEQMKTSPSVPWLIFSNSCCASSCGRDSNLWGIAGSFLKAGISQVIAPIKRIKDREALTFARSFYGCLFKGMPPAESLCLAKQGMQKDHPDSITPLLYRLYGDPCFSLKHMDLLHGRKQMDKKNIKPKLTSKILLGIGIALAIGLFILFFKFQTLTVLTILEKDEFSVFKKIVREFGKEHYAILRIENIECEEILSSLRQKKRIDVIVMDINRRSEIRMEKELQDLSKVKRRLIPATTHPCLIEHLQEKERNYFIPFRPNVRLLILNKERFQEFYGDPKNIPTNWTWQEILRFANTMKARKGEARVILNCAKSDAPLFLLELIRSAGGDPCDLTDNSSMQAFIFLRQLWPCVSVVDWKIATGYLQSEKAYIGRNWCFALKSLETGNQLDSFEIYAGPSWMEGSNPSNLLGGDYLAIAKRARNPKRALEFIEFLLSPEVQEKLARELWWPPIRTEIIAKLERDDKYGPYFQKIKKALNYAEPVPEWWNSDVNNLYSELFTKITSSDENLNSIVMAFQEQINTALKSTSIMSNK
ncbi:MAG: extracellular solute-binding protein [bacterium]